MSSYANTSERADWKRISLFAAGGIALTTFGAFLNWPYMQSVIVNLGTALILFGYLWVAERRLARRIDVLSSPRTLGEAQLRAREVLRAAPTRVQPDKPYDELIATCLTATGKKIMEAGFTQRRPTGPSVELCSPDTISITWQLQRTGETLTHRISFHDGTVVRTDPVDVSRQLDAEELRARLCRFEDQVFDGLLMIINRLGPIQPPY